MKTLNLSISIAVLSIALVHAQNGWTWQNPAPQGNNLNAIHVFSDGEILAAGDNSTVMRSINNGQLWEVHHYTLGSEYYAFDQVQFVNDNFGWAVVSDREGRLHIDISSDRGVTWETRAPLPFMIKDFYAIDEQQAWGVGVAHAMIRTIDGGQSWTIHNVDSAGHFSGFGCFFLDKNTGWIVGTAGVLGGSMGKILKTTDGGQNWTELFVNNAFGTGLTQVFFLNENTGWVGGEDGLIMGTVDGGLTWTTQHYLRNSFSAVLDIFFFDENNGVAVGTDNPRFINGGWFNNALTLNTSDGGQTWEERNSGTAAWIRDLHPVDNFTIWASGHNGLLIRSEDRGQSWTPISRSVTDEYIYCVDFIDEMTGFAGGYQLGAGGLLLKTEDGGANWAVADTGEYQTTVLQFLDENNGFRIERLKNIYRTRDGGISWEQHDVLGMDGLYWDGCFADTSNGWLVWNYLGDGYVKRTGDGGLSWQTGLHTPGIWNYGIDFVNATTGWVCGADNYTAGNPEGHVFKTVDGGDTWVEQLSGFQHIYDIDFVDENAGWCIAASGIVLATADGGDTWNTVNTPLLQPTGLFFLDTNSGWIFGHDGVARTLDGGLNWETFVMPPGPNFAYDAAFFTSPDNGWLVGAVGHILKFDGAATGLSDNARPVGAPSDIQLYQNYPNPFNPVTNVEFGIRLAQWVTITIYNLLGQEVKTLMNDRLASGNYTVQWDGTNNVGQAVASGIYYYRLTHSSPGSPHRKEMSTAGENGYLYSQTKKMILLR